MARMTANLRANNIFRAYARGLSLRRLTRTSYIGEVEIYNPPTREVVSSGIVRVTITGFNADGSPEDWISSTTNQAIID